MLAELAKNPIIEHRLSGKSDDEIMHAIGKAGEDAREFHRFDRIAPNAARRGSFTIAFRSGL